MLYRFAMLLIFCVLATQNSYASADDTLVIINDNSIDSVAVGNYYAVKRNIPASNIVHVKSRSAFFTEWDDFISLRDQVIKFLQQRMVNETGLVPVVCANAASQYYCEESITQLRDNTSIRYLVTTRGVPTRMVVPNSTLSSPTGPTSVDNYLRHWLVNYFDDDVGFNSVERAKAFGDGRGMRTVDPSNDKELIIGRIDGLDVESAKKLVDRAIAAENNGVYGKLYGSKFGSTGGKARWYNYETNKQNYGTSLTAWKYQHGLFGDYFGANSSGIRFTSDNTCLDHIDNSASSVEGKSPQSCVVRLMNGNDAPPGRSSSRVPDPESALVYLGSLHGQPTTGDFYDFLNWQKEASCNDEVLCRDTADPVSCAAASTDIFKEINTDCVGVSEGFIGYNFQSYPVSYLTAWPTSWANSTSTAERFWNHGGGGESNKLGFPEVNKGDSSDGDGFSLWFRNLDQVADPQCFSDDSMTTTYSCPEEHKVAITNKTLFDIHTYDSVTPQTYLLTLKYKSKNIDRNTKLRARLLLHEPGKSQFQVSYGTYSFVLPGESVAHQVPVGDVNVWTLLQTEITIDPAFHAQARANCLADSKCTSSIGASYLSTIWDGRYDGLKMILETTGVFAGDLGIDDVEIVSVNSSDDMVLTNASFNQGHEQVAAGDHAANFLSRLNGTAFWGSLSHHQSGGHSFDSHPLETLIYFTRGLPLGDAVWFAENYNSGVLYGDPLYSPLAVKLNYVDQDRVINKMNVAADTVNGKDSNLVMTTYAVDYCSGDDFFICDEANSWTSTNLAGSGGSLGQSLGELDVFEDLAFGEYTVRLSVSSDNASLGKSQTMYDYYTVINQYTEEEVPTYTIAGYITNTEGQPVSGVSVDINTNTGFVSNVVTNSAGYYEKAGLNNGSYIVYPIKQGYQFTAVTGNVFHTINNQNTKDKDFIASSSDYFVSGTVLDANGQPVVDVPIIVNSNTGFVSTVTTNSNGYFKQVAMPNDTYLVMPEASSAYNFQINSGSVFTVINGANVENKDFTATPKTVYVSGSVLEANGNPVVSATVSLTNSVGTTFSASTNANGFYQINNVPNDLYIIQASVNGYTTSYQAGNVFTSVSGSSLENRDFLATKIQSTYFVAGYILENGQPLVGVSVFVADNYGFSTTITTDNSGFYKVEGLDPGLYIVYPTKTGYQLQPTSGNVFQTIVDASIIEKDFIATQTN